MDHSGEWNSFICIRGGLELVVVDRSLYHEAGAAANS